jgi:UPF0288 family protein (methanogenesis marker protein 3)
LRVLVNGKEIDLEEGAPLGEALKRVDSFPAEGAIVGLVKGRGEQARQTNSYWIITTKGKLRIELGDTDLQAAWHQTIDQIRDSEVVWSSKEGIAFGPFATAISWSKEPHEYNRW